MNIGLEPCGLIEKGFRPLGPITLLRSLHRALKYLCTFINTLTGKHMANPNLSTLLHGYRLNSNRKAVMICLYAFVNTFPISCGLLRTKFCHCICKVKIG